MRKAFFNLFWRTDSVEITTYLVFTKVNKYVHFVILSHLYFTIGMVIFIFSFFGLGVILGIIACIKNLRSKSRHGDENLAQSDLETGKLRKIDRKWAKALGIDLKPKEEK